MQWRAWILEKLASSAGVAGLGSKESMERVYQIRKVFFVGKPL